MNLKDYTEAAKLTESVIDTINVNRESLESVISIFINAGNILDDLKKNIYYGREFDKNKLAIQISKIAQEVKTIDIQKFYEPDNLDISISTRTLHAILGIATEGTEMVEALNKVLSGEEIDIINLAEENGDINWYQAIMLDDLGQDWDKMLEVNISKLNNRYKSKTFEAENANNRDLDSEREILKTIVK